MIFVFMEMLRGCSGSLAMSKIRLDIGLECLKWNKVGCLIDVKYFRVGLG